MSPSEKVNRFTLAAMGLAMWIVGVAVVDEGGFHDPVLGYYFDFGKYKLLVAAVIFVFGGWAFVVALRKGRSGTDRKK